LRGRAGGRGRRLGERRGRRHRGEEGEEKEHRYEQRCGAPAHEIRSVHEWKSPPRISTLVGTAADWSHVYTAGPPRSQRDALRGAAAIGPSLADERLDFLPVRLEAHEGAVFDEERGNAEPAEAAEQLEARRGVLADVEEVDGHAARLEERQRRV